MSVLVNRHMRVTYRSQNNAQACVCRLVRQQQPRNIKPRHPPQFLFAGPETKRRDCDIACAIGHCPHANSPRVNRSLMNPDRFKFSEMVIDIIRPS